ncbi:MAG: SpaA isopeptide-forming pilin-related protein [Peptostreptococcaceae bacterium]|nr:SpaA isopeptide-forming pilin-related protein [Peptostreptococcaceae bacterium]
MNSKVKTALVCLAASILIVCNFLLPPNFSFAINNVADPDLSGKIWGEEAVVGGLYTVNTVLSNPEIRAGERVDFTLKFFLNTKSDIPEDQRVQPKDIVHLILSEDFVISGTESIDINYRDSKIAIGTFATKTIDGKDQLSLTIDFDDTIDLSNFSVDNVPVVATISLSYNKKVQGDSIEASLAKQNFTVLPHSQSEYTLTKSGEVTAKGTIRWTVQAEATKGSLKDIRFVDDLNKVGAYVENSFKIYDNGIDGIAPQTGFKKNDTVIEYTFDDRISQKLTFETKIKNYFQNFDLKEVQNTAYLKTALSDTVAEAQASLPIPPRQWITKSGTADPTNKQILWTIEINEPKADLGNIKVKDYLNLEQKFVSGSYRIGDDPTIHDIGDRIKNKNGFEIQINDVKDKIILTIISSYPYDGLYTNTAELESMSITNFPVQQAFSQINTKGDIDFIKKMIPADEKSKPQDYSNKSIKFDADLRAGTLEWQIELDQVPSNGEYYIYDLLVYGEDRLIKNADNKNIIPPNIIASEHQKYDSGLDPSYVTKITKDNKVVADLIKIPAKDLPKIHGKKVISYKTKVLSHQAIFSNWGMRINNSAFLYKDNDIISVAEAGGEFQNSILYKSALDPNHSNAENLQPDNQPEIAATYNHRTGEIFYRLSVNAGNADFTKYETIDGPLSPIIVEDILPSELEFINFPNENVPYKIYVGHKNNAGIDSLVHNNTTPLTKTEILDHEIETKIDQNNIKFMFKKLDKPYVIILRTKLTDAQYEKYLKQWKDPDPTSFASIVNNSYFYTANDLDSARTPNSEPTYSRNTTIYPTFFDKKVEEVNNILRWRIEYKPYLISASDNITITDILPEAVQLPLGIDGQPMISTDPNEKDRSKVKIIAQNIRPDGDKYSFDNNTFSPNTLDVKYEAERGHGKLIFTPKDPSKAYIIEYFTPYSSKARANRPITNQATLFVDGERYRFDSASYVIDANFSISAWLSDLHSVQIVKVDADTNQVLSNAQFALYTKGTDIKIKDGATNERGELIFTSLEQGDYTLKEIAPPKGYELSNKTYTITVASGKHGALTTTVTEDFSGQTLAGPIIKFKNKKSASTISDGSTISVGEHSSTEPKSSKDNHIVEKKTETFPQDLAVINSSSVDTRPDPVSKSDPQKVEQTDKKQEDRTTEGKKQEDKKTETPTQNPGIVKGSEQQKRYTPDSYPEYYEGRRVIGVGPNGELIFDDETPFSHLEKEVKKQKELQGKVSPGMISASPKTGSGEISVTYLGNVFGACILLIVLLSEFVESKRDRK